MVASPVNPQHAAENLVSTLSVSVHRDSLKVWQDLNRFHAHPLVVCSDMLHVSHGMVLDGCRRKRW